MDAAVRGSRRRSAVTAVMAMTTVAMLAGCVAAPTPQIIYYTPPPTPITIYVTPPPTPAPEPTPTPTPEPSPTATSAPTSAATSRAHACTGNAENKAFFAAAAVKMKIAVYCAILPKGWSVAHGEYDAGKLMVVYTKGGADVGIEEGYYCTSGPVMCAGMGGVDMGAATFGGMAGKLMNFGGMYAVIVNPGTSKAYAMIASGVTATQAKSFAAKMSWVPRS